MKQFIIPLCILLVGAGCKKDLLDIDSGICFSVNDLLDSRNADVACGKAADFEGKSLCLEGTLEEEADSGLSRKFFLRDASQFIEVQVDSSIAAEVLALVKANEGKSATVKGIMTGFDKPQNLKCRRGFVQHLSDMEDLEIQ